MDRTGIEDGSKMVHPRCVKVQKKKGIDYEEEVKISSIPNIEDRRLETAILSSNKFYGYYRIISTLTFTVPFTAAIAGNI